MIRDNQDCTTEEELREIVHAVHRNIIESGGLVGGDNGIGTTFSAVRILPDKFMLAHVGDSSVYHKNGQGFEHISTSHTLGNELIEKHGPEAMNDMPDHYMHTLTRCMGQDIDFSVDVSTYSIKAGDGVLICSDGVTNMVDEDIIESVMKEHEPKDYVPALIDLANQNGGVDNSTIVSFLVN
jgi:protein phosphatase